MASTPGYAATPHLKIKRWATTNTARDGTGSNIQTLATIGASGGRLESISIKSDGDFADSVVTIFMSDDGGTTWFLFDEFDVGNPVAASNTVSGYREQRGYGGLLMDASMKIGAALTVAPTAGSVVAYVEYSDL